MNWLTRNSKTIIKSAYILPILIAAGVSISHVIAWYGLTNPVSWAIYLSIGIEIAALSALAGITTKIGNGAYIPFIIVTFIQFIGNIFYAYQYIDVNSVIFKDWVDLVGGLYGHGDIKFHRQILALIGGGFIPMISLSFLHLLVSFTNKEDSSNSATEPITEDVSDTSKDDATIPTDLFSPKEEINDDTNDIGAVNDTVNDVVNDAVNDAEEDSEVEFEANGVANDKDEKLVPELETKEELDIKTLIESHKKEKEKKISVDEIKEIKDRRKFSVPIPRRSNSVERIGTNKTLEHGKQDKITFKKR